MSIEENHLSSLGTSADSLFQAQKETPKAAQRKYKILLISENSSDTYIVKKVLAKERKYLVHAVETVVEALKVVNYLSIDLILVDDMLSDLDGYDVVQKFHHMDVTKDIPKIILLTEGYKSDKKESFRRKNLDFIKKPFDVDLFTLRIESMLSLHGNHLGRKSYFKQEAEKTFQNAQAYMSIYQDIFEKSSNIMCIYDNSSAQMVESNTMFEQFFLNIPAFNRIMSNSKLVRKFVPYMEEVNYLNYYDPKEWMKTLIEADGFHYLIKLHRDFKEYSFNISVKKIQIDSYDFYLLTLHNVYDYLPQNKNEKTENKVSLKEKNLLVFKDDFIKLRTAFLHNNVQSKEIETLLYQLSTKLSIVSEDASIIDAYEKEQKECNVYFLIATLLKTKYSDGKSTLNTVNVQQSLEENRELIYADIHADALHDLLSGILSHYYGSSFSSTNQKELAVKVQKEAQVLSIVLEISKMENASLVTKLFQKDTKLTQEEIITSLPKNVKQAFDILSAQIEATIVDKQQIFKIQIPLA